MKRANIELAVLLFIAIASILAGQSLFAGAPSGIASGIVNIEVTNPNHFSEFVRVVNETTVDTARSIVIVLRANQTSAGDFNVTKQGENPTNAVPTGKTAAKYVVINTDINISNATITYTYTSSEISGIDENTLRLYRFSTQLNDWVLLTGGVDTSAKQVSGLTTSFSSFGVFGTPSSGSVANAAATASTAGATVGGGVEAAPVFDVLVKIVEGYEITKQGEYLLTTVHIANFGQAGRKDIVLKYEILDASDHATFIGKETVAIETTLNIVRKITLPSNLVSGNYKLQVTAEADGEKIAGSAQFTISAPSLLSTPTAQFFAGRPNALLAAAIMSTFAICILAILAYRHLKSDEAFRDYVRNYFKYWKNK